MESLFKLLADLPSIGINANEWTAGLTSAVGPWIAGGLGLGAAILGVLIGWHMLRHVSDDENAEECSDEEPFDAAITDDDIDEASENSGD